MDDDVDLLSILICPNGLGVGRVNLLVNVTCLYDVYDDGIHVLVVCDVHDVLRVSWIWVVSIVVHDQNQIPVRLNV